MISGQGRFAPAYDERSKEAQMIVDPPNVTSGRNATTHNTNIKNII